MAAKGGTLAEIVSGDFLELLDAERGARSRTRDYSAVSWRLLRQAARSAAVTGIAGPAAHGRAAQPCRARRPLPARLRPVRDLIVDYLQERQPALDYRSLDTLAQQLARNFWADLERHHPGIASLNLPPPVAAAWKQRMRTRATAPGRPTGSGWPAATPSCQSALSTLTWPAGPPKTPPAGASGPFPARSPKPTSKRARKKGAASPGWTAAPASACPSCRPWPARPPATATGRPGR